MYKALFLVWDMSWLQEGYVFKNNYNYIKYRKNILE